MLEEQVGRGALARIGPAGPLELQEFDDLPPKAERQAPRAAFDR